MTIQEVKKYYQEKLHTIYDDDEIKTITLMVLEHVLQIDRTEIRLRQTDHYLLLKEEQNQVESIIKELVAFKPVQYSLGEASFYGLLFKVNEKVLIPRPETEELVDWIIKEYESVAKTKELTILDIGTGSGCIPIALVKNLLGKYYAIDISSGAISIAHENAKRHQVEIIIEQGDILQDAVENLPYFDVIVSNPPYITFEEKKHMKENVLEYEPHKALFVEDPLLFYRRIAQVALIKLKAGGKLFFEINQYYGKETIDLLENLGYHSVELRKDLQGNDRMIRAIRF